LRYRNACPFSPGYDASSNAPCSSITKPNDPKAKTFGVHPDVLKLGLVSFLTDLSSEMIFSVFAIFFTTVAGASAALLGVVEGLADLSASSLNYFAGWLSDRTGKRKVFALAGYGFSTLAMVPAVLSMVALSFIKDQPAPQRQRENMFETWRLLSPEFKRYLVTAGIFSLAYFSFGFLLLRAHSVGFSVKDTVLLYALFNVACVIAAPMIGKLSDKVKRPRMIMLGYFTYLVMSLGFAFASTQWQVLLLFILYGVFYAIDEAQNKAFIADLEQTRRASAIGLYNFVTGVIYLPASLIAGALWLRNPSAAFLLAAALACTALVVFIFQRRGQLRA
jgi:MFS family permease